MATVCSNAYPLDRKTVVLTPCAGTSKFYKGYEMTSLGENQIFDTGSYYRSRYIEDGAPNQILGISPDKYKASQLWTSAPDQSVSGPHSIHSRVYPVRQRTDVNKDSPPHRDRFSPRAVPTAWGNQQGVSGREIDQWIGCHRAPEWIPVHLDPWRIRRGA